LNVKDYSAARKYAARILHTIHDFYSHSNWVEMGNKKINKEIGTRNFSKYDTTDLEDPNTCVSNCSTIEIECNSILRALVSLIKRLGVRSSIINCPITYFICEGNIIINDKLVSGFYVDQGIEKPDNAMKCSHGGILDGSSFKPAIGGINKDSGYFVFSPHANLHLEAANLAIDHTEFFFEEIRKKNGNDEFSNFLKLEVSSTRKYAARILHTIHDFYSHSNWVEMGNKKINKEIGTRNFSKYDTTDLEDPNTCVSNCSTIEIECNTLIRALVKVVKKLGVRSSIINCPIKYFRCNGNIVTNSKLVSGFYVDQGIEKPENTMKCSHGGILDSSSYKKAVGGINKDSGYFVFSPHANLHLEAAKLAIDHTEFFFEEIRKKIGNDEFSKFLNLEVSKIRYFSAKNPDILNTQ
ncbi:von Willebrand factor A domain-containing 7 isoform X1, partial [Brachionus plicatilis]